MSRRARRRRKTPGASPGGAAACKADLGGSSKYSNENFEGRRGLTGGRVQPGRKSTARRVVSGPAPAALKIRGPSAAAPAVLQPHRSLQGEQPSMEQCRQGKSAKWIRNPGKGLARGWHGVLAPTRLLCGESLRAAPRGESGSSRVAGGDGSGTAFGVFPPEQIDSRIGTDKGNPTLIKTKHCDGPRCSRNVISRPCQCQSEEIQPSAGKRSNYDSLKVAKCLVI
ncbi:hypothetical protein DH2020_003933 [Rehmannia glutinosa]|uniref:Uncharacterized protein n=1 Tax=Rehmannia glutinosa TaxID=99300 RepID=A0ABR0XN49_REHGL